MRCDAVGAAGRAAGSTRPGRSPPAPGSRTVRRPAARSPGGPRRPRSGGTRTPPPLIDRPGPQQPTAGIEQVQRCRASRRRARQPRARCAGGGCRAPSTACRPAPGSRPTREGRPQRVPLVLREHQARRCHASRGAARRRSRTARGPRRSCGPARTARSRARRARAISSGGDRTQPSSVDPVGQPAGQRFARVRAAVGVPVGGRSASEGASVADVDQVGLVGVALVGRPVATRPGRA